MNAREKRRYIRELISRVQKDILEKVSDLPEEWDGHELRRYIADAFEASAFTVGARGWRGRDYRARTRRYRQTCLERNLIIG